MENTTRKEESSYEQVRRLRKYQIQLQVFLLNPQIGYLKIDTYLLNLVSHNF